MKAIILFCLGLVVSSAAIAQQDTTNQKPINPTSTAYLHYHFNTPLYVIDGLVHKGILVNGKLINDINPDKIDNIHVFKGESAKYLYGEKGKNGVVVITTKEFAKKSKVQKE